MRSSYPGAVVTRMIALCFVFSFISCRETVKIEFAEAEEDVFEESQ